MTMLCSVQGLGGTGSSKVNGFGCSRKIATYRQRRQSHAIDAASRFHFGIVIEKTEFQLCVKEDPKGGRIADVLHFDSNYNGLVISDEPARQSRDIDKGLVGQLKVAFSNGDG